MLVGEKIKRADTGGIGALSISSVEAALALSLLSEKKKTRKQVQHNLKKLLYIVKECQSKRLKVNLTVDDRLIVFSLFSRLGFNVIV